MKKIILLLFSFLFFANAHSQERINYPSPKKSDRVDYYFGTAVPDPYRWMEDVDSPEVKEWVQEENNITEDYFSKIPFREKIRARLTEIWNYPKYFNPFKTGRYYFYLKNDGLQNQSVLYRLEGINGQEEVFIDPNTFSSDGTIALMELSPRNDGKYLAYNISVSGSDWRETFVMRIEDKKKLKDHLKHVKFSSAAWYKDGFFYTRYNEPKGNEMTGKNEYPKIYYHKLGEEQSKDGLVYGAKENPNYFYGIGVTDDEKYVLLGVSTAGRNGNSLYFAKAEEFERWLSGTEKSQMGFTPISEDMNHTHWLFGSEGNRFFILTDSAASNYRVISVSAENPEAGWTDVIPEKDFAFDGVNFIGGKLIASYIKDATSKVYVYNSKGQFENEINLPVPGSADVSEGTDRDKEFFYSFTSFTYPGAIFLYDIDSRTSRLFRSSEVKFNPEDYETKQVFYKSKDGTSVPMFIVHKKGLTLNARNPAYLYAYGGFNFSLTPYFNPSRILFLENGGVFVAANLRGGGEYGEKWHKAGMLLNKQNVFDDFIAAAEYLINEKYTSPEMLAVNGASNGGLLIGAVINQRPELFKAALPAVGVMDMLRFQNFTIGAAWTTEFGSSEDSVNFKNLYSFSPLHNVREEINYPAILVTTADHDDRVVPSHSFKYTATLQEKYRGTNPVLIRIETKAGHGSGRSTSQIIDEVTDVWSFVFYNLGITPK